jgi:hypothetical protein
MAFLLRALAAWRANLKQSCKLPAWLELLAPHLLYPQVIAPRLVCFVGLASLAWVCLPVLLTAVFLHVSQRAHDMPTLIARLRLYAALQPVFVHGQVSHWMRCWCGKDYCFGRGRPCWILRCSQHYGLACCYAQLFVAPLQMRQELRQQHAVVVCLAYAYAALGQVLK